MNDVQEAVIDMLLRKSRLRAACLVPLVTLDRELRLNYDPEPMIEQWPREGAEL